jgi:hypothetical protein
MLHRKKNHRVLYCVTHAHTHTHTHTRAHISRTFYSHTPARRTQPPTRYVCVIAIIIIYTFTRDPISASMQNGAFSGAKRSNHSARLCIVCPTVKTVYSAPKALQNSFIFIFFFFFFIRLFKPAGRPNRCAFTTGELQLCTLPLGFFRYTLYTPLACDAYEPRGPVIRFSPRSRRIKRSRVSRCTPSEYK